MHFMVFVFHSMHRVGRTNSSVEFLETECYLTYDRHSRNWLSDSVSSESTPQQSHRLTDWLSKAKRPTKHIIGHIGDGFYGSNDPTNSVKALKEDRSIELGFNPIRSTPPCSQWYNNYAVWNKTKNKNTHKHKWTYAQWNGPSVTKLNPENCKNCSSKCAYDCVQLQYTTQHRTVLIISPLTSRQTS